MIYLIYGLEDYLINSFIEKTIKENSCDITLKYYYPDTSIFQVIEELNYLSLFGEKKAVVLYNSTFLSSDKDVDTDDLIKYIDNKSEDNVLFIVLNQEKIDERKKIVKKLNEFSTVKYFNKLKDYDINKYVLDYINKKEYKITNELVSEIVSKVGSNLRMIINEVDKLLIYKEDKIITKEDIESVISVSLETDIYKLLNSVTGGNVSKMMEYYNDLVQMGNHPSLILTMLANQFRLLYQVKILLKDGYKDQEITKMLGVHPYQIKLAIEKSYNFSESKLIDIIYKLSLIDENIKTNKVDIDSSLEIFFLEL